MIKRWLGRLVLAGLFVCAPALAGQPCNDAAPSAESLQKTFRLALKTLTELESSGASVALIGRVGQDLSQYRLRFSHAALAWRDHPDGRWLVVHELNNCGTARSGLFNEGLANFFGDDLFAWDALVIYPSPALQERLAARLKSGSATYLHEPNYNMLAFPFSTLYQNSNQWLLEVLAEALADTTFISRGEAQTWLKAAGFQPTTLEIPALTRLGARMFRANVAFDDHPTDRRMAGQIDVVSVESLAAFLQAKDPAARRELVRLP